MALASITKPFRVLLDSTLKTDLKNNNQYSSRKHDLNKEFVLLRKL